MNTIVEQLNTNFVLIIEHLKYIQNNQKKIEEKIKNIEKNLSD